MNKTSRSSHKKKKSRSFSLCFSEKPNTFTTHSSLSLVEFATIADYKFEASSSSSPKANADLEVAKLGIAQEIIFALSKRGITKLFPIQVALALY